MRLIGTIARLQVQELSLKVAGPRWRRYDPAGLRSVPVLELNDGGVRGWTSEETPLDDVHHRDHPASKNRGGENGISVCFTSHYGAMRERFGAHLPDGIAGENILVETDALLTGSDLAGGIVVMTTDGREIRLDQIFPAAPCVEFSRYALRFPDDARPDETVAEALRFLNDGTRGYYASYHGPAARITLGDRVLARQAERRTDGQ
ncbi:MAG: hypothetical protein QOG89_3229 [Thermomicrobiales bacterium]|nr:hypothetical protein [Thermomicrobiales bacterium]